MLALSDGGRLRTGPEWAFEWKYDGYRACMRIAPDGTTVLTSRNNRDTFTEEFAELTGVLGPALEGRAAVLDGEIVAYDANGRIDFGLLQRSRGRDARGRRSAARRRGDPVAEADVRFVAFDLLQLEAKSLLHLSYDQRRAQLLELQMPDPYRVGVARAFTWVELDADHTSPVQLLQLAEAAGYEGLVAKRRDAPYTPGKRTDAFLKHPIVHTTEVIVCGYRPGKSRLSGVMGGLVLGAHTPDGDLVYVGDVGTGFSEAQRDQLQARLDQLTRDRQPFTVAPPRADVKDVIWVDPILVGDVVYRQFTSGGRLRHTAWRGLRPDRDPEEITVPSASLEAATAGGAGDASAPRTATLADDPPTASEDELGPTITVQAGERQLTLSSLDKPLYPGNRFTKGEVINYYSRIAPVLLPHLTGRPVTFVRYPDGVEHEKFFQKDVPAGAPAWLPTVALPRTGARSDRGTGTITYVLIEELAALVWAANIAALELHVPQWRIQPGPPVARAAPDRLVFDLDPGPGTSVVECCRVAERLQDILVDDGLAPHAKTSGSKGLQVYCGISTDDAAAPSAYAKKLAQRLARETPDRVTALMAKDRRTGKVFIDWSQNHPNKTTIAPYSLRGLPIPTVSTPVTWAEVRSCRKVEQLVFRAEDVLDRVDECGDLFAELAVEIAALPPS
ncbi:DNA ligase D [Amycolatopsis sp. cmx-4-61]|uniref:DNA ligase D n=1 Tax=Amycolatopsis sp. cmx-4-61 TaxID=2790937 RepID=UPI003979488B